MATTTLATTDAHAIVKDPAILDGEPTIAGTRVPVQAVVLMHRMHGRDITRVQRSLPTLSDDDIRATLDYYKGHWREIIGYMRRNSVDAEFIRSET